MGNQWNIHENNGCDLSLYNAFFYQLASFWKWQNHKTFSSFACKKSVYLLRMKKTKLYFKLYKTALLWIYGGFFTGVVKSQWMPVASAIKAHVIGVTMTSSNDITTRSRRAMALYTRASGGCTIRWRCQPHPAIEAKPSWWGLRTQIKKCLHCQVKNVFTQINLCCHLHSCHLTKFLVRMAKVFLGQVSSNADLETLAG